MIGDLVPDATFSPLIRFGLPVCIPVPEDEAGKVQSLSLAGCKNLIEAEITLELTIGVTYVKTWYDFALNHYKVEGSAGVTMTIDLPNDDPPKLFILGGEPAIQWVADFATATGSAPKYIYDVPSGTWVPVPGDPGIMGLDFSLFSGTRATFYRDGTAYRAKFFCSGTFGFGSGGPDDFVGYFYVFTGDAESYGGFYPPSGDFDSFTTTWRGLNLTILIQRPNPDDYDSLDFAAALEIS